MTLARWDLARAVAGAHADWRTAEPLERGVRAVIKSGRPIAQVARDLKIGKRVRTTTPDTAMVRPVDLSDDHRSIIVPVLVAERSADGLWAEAERVADDVERVGFLRRREPQVETPASTRPRQIVVITR